MKQILTMKGRSSGMKLVMVLVVTLVGLAGTPATAQVDDNSWMPDPDSTDVGTGCSWDTYEDCAITDEDVSGASTAPSTASASVSASAPSTTSAAPDQYEPVAETNRNSSALPLMLGLGALLVGGGLLARRHLR